MQSLLYCRLVTVIMVIIVSMILVIVTMVPILPVNPVIIVLHIIVILSVDLPRQHVFDPVLQLLSCGQVFIVGHVQPDTVRLPQWGGQSSTTGHLIQFNFAFSSRDHTDSIVTRCPQILYVEPTVGTQLKLKESSTYVCHVHNSNLRLKQVHLEGLLPVCGQLDRGDRHKGIGAVYKAEQAHQMK